MSKSIACLSIDQIAELAQDDPSPQRCSELEDHLSLCERCRLAMEDYDDGKPWLQEVHAALNDGTEIETIELSGCYELDKEIDASLRGILQLLGPTDDPRMMGRIGNYEIVGVLGRGGMGVVFKAFDPALNRYVAIKMLLPHLALTGSARKRFAREAQAAAAVVNDHVIAIHAVAEWQGLPFLVMPYGRGESLQKRLNERGPLELPEILRIGMQTAKGLAAAHAQGLVHRDVKPANILLDEGVDRVVLTDFGLARAIDDIGLTRDGLLAGTPQYMSPEQATGKQISSPSDLFSLGCVLYVMCTGLSPFRAESSYAVLRLITDSQPKCIRVINPAIPAWLERLIEKLLIKDPATRMQSANELADLLERCLAHVQQPLVVSLPHEVDDNASVTSLRILRPLCHVAICCGLVATVSLAIWSGQLFLEDQGKPVHPIIQPAKLNDEISSSAAATTIVALDHWDSLQNEFDSMDALLRPLERRVNCDLEEQGAIDFNNTNVETIRNQNPPTPHP